MSPQLQRDAPDEPRILPHAPEELTRGRLRRLGEGIGKVVYASEHWVVKRERSPSAIVALIVLWKVLRRIEHLLPGRLGQRLLQKPSCQLRFLRVLVQASMVAMPKAVWFTSHIRQVWKQYHFRSARGERLARARLAGSEFVPEHILFPPTRVRVGGWPGWLTVSEATERVEETLYHRLAALAQAGRFDELEKLLDRFLDIRLAGWRLGVFSVDAHLKNFGVIEDRIVLLDTGGLTNRWTDVEQRLEFEEVIAQPHIQLGLGPFLGGQPEIADRFNARWKAIVNREVVGRMWRGEPLH
jgi:hypothetical protein